MFCSREYQPTSRLNQQNEKSTSNYVDVYVVVIGVFGAGVITSVTGLGLCVAVFEVDSGFKPVKGPCGVFASG